MRPLVQCSELCVCAFLKGCRRMKSGLHNLQTTILLVPSVTKPGRRSLSLQSTTTSAAESNSDFASEILAILPSASKYVKPRAVLQEGWCNKTSHINIGRTSTFSPSQEQGEHPFARSHLPTAPERWRATSAWLWEWDLVEDLPLCRFALSKQWAPLLAQMVPQARPKPHGSRI